MIDRHFRLRNVRWRTCTIATVVISMRCPLWRAFSSAFRNWFTPDTDRWRYFPFHLHAPGFRRDGHRWPNDTSNLVGNVNKLLQSTQRERMTINFSCDQYVCIYVRDIRNEFVVSMQELWPRLTVFYIFIYFTIYISYNIIVFSKHRKFISIEGAHREK